VRTIRSADGTELALDVEGSGPPIVLVDGAFGGRAFGPMADIARHLAKHATVFRYDRRGRGGSGDTKPFSVALEIEDLRAVCAEADGPPFVYATSSGAALALRAAGGGVRMRRLAVYEPPFYLDGTFVPTPPDFRERIAALLADDRRDDAVKLFMRVVGVPSFGVWMMRLIPSVWPHLRAAAHTLPYDFAALGDSQRGGAMPAELAEVLGHVTVPTHVLIGGKSPQWMMYAAQVTAALVPQAQLRVIAGQTHTIATKAIVPVLVELVTTPSGGPG
jgi:hypothetical protein